jgi:Amt family ammonium transporter
MNDSTFQICGVLLVLVPLTLAGLSLINTGFGRARSAATTMLSSLAAIAIAATLYCLVGFSWEGVAGGSSHFLMLGGKPWDWIAAEPLLMRGVVFNGSSASMAILLQVFLVGIAALIPISSGADRWRLRSTCISTVMLAVWTFPLFAHWVWGGGWLAQLGSNFNLGQGFLDAGGAGTVQVVGGVSALAITLILGPRRGKYIEGGGSAAVPGHNVIYVLFGCAVVVPGWIAMNSAGAILFAGISPSRIPLIAVTTLLSAAASCLATVVATRMRFGKPDASLCANGWLGGLVASSAVCCFVTPAVAIVIGLIAGMLVAIAVEALDIYASVDDPGGAVSVHAVAGIWGLLAVGIFPHIADSSLAAGGMSGQFLAQVVGVATLLGLVFPMVFGLNWILNRIDPQRVEHRGERIGMDLHELGGGAYPEFVIRTEE